MVGNLTLNCPLSCGNLYCRNVVIFGDVSKKWRQNLELNAYIRPGCICFNFQSVFKNLSPPRGKSLMSLEKPSSDRVDLSEAKNVDVVQKIILLCGKFFFKLVFEFFWHVCFGKKPHWKTQYWQYCFHCNSRILFLSVLSINVLVRKILENWNLGRRKK